jgi:hypothetical protein
VTSHSVEVHPQPPVVPPPLYGAIPVRSYIFRLTIIFILKYYHFEILFRDWSRALGAGQLGFDSQQREDFSLLHSVQTGPEAHPAPYPLGTGSSFPLR